MALECEKAGLVVLLCALVMLTSCNGGLLSLLRLERRRERPFESEIGSLLVLSSRP